VHRKIIDFESKARSRSALGSSILSRRCVDAPVIPLRSARAIIACGTFRGRGKFPRSSAADGLPRDGAESHGSRKIERGPQNYKGEARAGEDSVAGTTAALMVHVGIDVSRGRTRPARFGVIRRSRRSLLCTRRAEESVREEAGAATRADDLVARDA